MASPEELARLEALPDGRPDRENPRWSSQQISIAAELRRRRVSRRTTRVRKQRITLQLDEDLLAHFRAPGKPGYQTRINDALRAHVAHRSAAGSPVDLIELAKAVLEEAERMLEEDDRV